jgi:hypothetical protein
LLFVTSGGLGESGRDEIQRRHWAPAIEGK